MDWITDHVAIGNYLEVQDTDLLRRYGFRSALSLDGTLPPERAAELGLGEVVSIRLVDGPGNDIRHFQFAVDSLQRLVEEGAPVLVQCHAGRSRSAAVVAGYLMRLLGHEPNDAIAIVSSKRQLTIAPALQEMLFNL